MQLYSIILRNFKCYENSGEIPFYDLTIFIGENDAGKSTILDAIEFLLDNKNVQIENFRDGCDELEIIAKFKSSNPPDEIKRFFINGVLEIKKKISKTSPLKVELLLERFTDKALNEYEGMNVEDLKNLLDKLTLSSKSNQEDRKASVKLYIDSNPELPKAADWVEIKWNQISNFLPIFQRYSSSEYGNPESAVKKTLEIAYRSAFYETNTEGTEVLKSNFNTLKSSITTDLNNKLETQLLSHIKRYKPEIQSLSGSYDIDFARGLSFSGLNFVDTSGRVKSLHQIGEGSKKKIFLSILEWDAEINLSTSSHRQIIRGYDEPDANLHYDAQRKMFYVLRDLVKSPTSNIQSIICTHSLAMIDRAAAQSINHVKRDEITEKSEINFLKTDNDSDISEFLNQVSEISGIKNSSIFYEKCFLVVEGESEQNALPIMYKKYSGRNLSEDGIILINLQTNGQWNNALKFLHANRRNCTVVLLDSDTQYSTSSNQVTKEKLETIGFGSSFLTTNCFFAGTKEFEDIFTDPQLKAICNEKFIKNNKIDWIENDFLNIRAEEKFSESLKITLSKECKKSIGKPEIAVAIAEAISKEEIENINILKSLFDKISDIIQ